MRRVSFLINSPLLTFRVAAPFQLTRHEPQPRVTMDVENTARSSLDRKLTNMEHVEERGGAETARSAVASEIPIKEVIEAHMDEDESRIKKIRRKVDIRLVGVLAALYVTAFLDRANLGNVSRAASLSFIANRRVRPTSLVWGPI